MLDQIDMALAQLQDIRNKIVARQADDLAVADRIAAADQAKAEADNAKAQFAALKDQLVSAIGGLTAQLQSLGV